MTVRRVFHPKTIHIIVGITRGALRVWFVSYVGVTARLVTCVSVTVRFVTCSGVTSGALKVWCARRWRPVEWRMNIPTLTENRLENGIRFLTEFSQGPNGVHLRP